MGKRGNNEGSIYRRLDGRWCASISVEGGRRKYLYGKTRVEVRKKLTAASASRDQGLPLGDGRITVGRFLERWLEDCAKPRVRPRTWDNYAMHVTAHLVPALGRTTLAKLTPDKVQRFVNEKSKAGLSPRSVRLMHGVLRMALDQAVRWGLLARNVATLVSLPKLEHKEVRPLDPAQVRKLLDGTKRDRLGPLFTVTAAMGLRQGEALALKWDDVHLDAFEPTLRVRATLMRRKGAWSLQPPKSERSRRTLTLPKIAIQVLKKQKAQQAQERLLAGSRWEEHGFVFANLSGGPLYGQEVTRHLQAVLAELELPRQRFHDLRHCAASLLLAQGVHPRVAMEILGHSQIQVTMDLYSHVMQAQQRDAADKIDDALRG